MDKAALQKIKAKKKKRRKQIEKDAAKNRNLLKKFRQAGEKQIAKKSKTRTNILKARAAASKTKAAAAKQLVKAGRYASKAKARAAKRAAAAAKRGKALFKSAAGSVGRAADIRINGDNDAVINKVETNIGKIQTKKNRKRWTAIQALINKEEFDLKTATDKELLDLRSLLLKMKNTRDIRDKLKILAKFKKIAKRRKIDMPEGIQYLIPEQEQQLKF